MCTLGTLIIICLFEFKYTSVSIILTSPAHQYRFNKHKHKSSTLHVTETHSVSVSVGLSVCPSGDTDSGECALGVKCVDLGLIAGTAPLDFLDPRVTFVSGCKLFRFLCTLVVSSPVNDSLGQTFEGCSCSVFLHLL